jgi:UDP-2,4-diacetamido-2,4,6-trideoxy-beta-L-altropyranose hydrolase
MNIKKIIFIRVDVSSSIGAGHFMRMIAFGELMVRHKFQVHFFCYPFNKSIIENLLHPEFKLHYSESQNSIDDLKFIIKKSKLLKPKLIVLDGNHFSEEYDSTLRLNGLRTLLINDVPNRRYTTDYILNQNHGSDKFNYQVGNETILLTGLKYLLIRNEFKNLKFSNKSLNYPKVKLLVSLGGGSKLTDQLNEMILVAISELENKISSATILVGKMGQISKRMIRISKNASFKIKIKKHTNNIAAEMFNSDIAITSGGYTMWELIYAKVPFIAFALNTLQEEYLQGLVNEKLCEAIMPLQKNNLDNLKQKLIDFIDNKRSHKNFIKLSDSLIYRGEGDDYIIKSLHL